MIFFFTKNPNLKKKTYIFFVWGGWVRGAGVSEFFYYESKFKIGVGEG